MEKGKRKANGEPEATPSSLHKHSRGNESGVNAVGVEEADALKALQVSTPKELSTAIIRDDADLPIFCLHDVSFPEGYRASNNETSKPLLPPKPAREYPFTLDPFQREAIQCLDHGESVLKVTLSSRGSAPGPNPQLTNPSAHTCAASQVAILNSKISSRNIAKTTRTSTVPPQQQLVTEFVALW